MYILRSDLVRILYNEIFIKNNEIFQDKGLSWLCGYGTNSTNPDIKRLYEAIIKDEFIQNNPSILDLSSELNKAKNIANGILSIHNDICYITHIYLLEQGKKNVQLKKPAAEIHRNIDTKTALIKSIIHNDSDLNFDAKKELIIDLIDNKYNGSYTTTALENFSDSSIFQNPKIELYGYGAQGITLGDRNTHTMEYDGNNGNLIMYNDTRFISTINIEKYVKLSSEIIGLQPQDYNDV